MKTITRPLFQHLCNISCDKVASRWFQLGCSSRGFGRRRKTQFERSIQRGTCSLVPLEKNGLVPQIQNLDFLCSLFPKMACVLLFPLLLGLCSPVPLKKIAFVSPFPKIPGRVSFDRSAVTLNFTPLQTSPRVIIQCQKLILESTFNAEI